MIRLNDPAGIAVPLKRAKAVDRRPGGLFYEQNDYAELITPNRLHEQNSVAFDKVGRE